MMEDDYVTNPPVIEAGILKIRTIKVESVNR